jgi:hypothetical protein
LFDHTMPNLTKTTLHGAPVENIVIPSAPRAHKVLARQQHLKDLNDDGVAFVQNTGGTAPPLVGDILCWYCGKKGHYRSDCPKLQVQEFNIEVKNLNIGDCEKGHGLFLSKKDKSLAIVQDKEKEEKGV